MSRPRWVIHLPSTLTSPELAVDLVAALRESLAHVSALDFDEVTLSEEDQQYLRRRVYCAARLPDADRCGLRDGHDGECRTLPP